MIDDDEYNSIMNQMQEQERQQRENAQQLLAVTCDRLTELGITRVLITYDGYGDSGNIESVVAYAGEEDVELASEIDAALQEAAYDLLPGGWEINDGSFGELVLDVSERRLVREHNWRITESEYEEEEFSL
jgi:hypothetical protein